MRSPCLCSFVIKKESNLIFLAKTQVAQKELLECREREISSLEEIVFFMRSLKILRKTIIKKNQARHDGAHLSSQNLGGRGGMRICVPDYP